MLFIHRLPALALTLAALFALTACREPAPKPEGDTLAPLVEAVQAQFGTLPLVERLSGTVLAENQIALFSETEGQITRVLAENGDAVSHGQPLVELRSTAIREQVRQAEAGERIAEARVRQAEASLAQLEAEVRRTRELGTRGLVTELELETASARIASARADIALARAQLDQAKATLAEQRDLLARTVVRAPFAGVVGQRNAEVGMQITPSTQLFTVGNLDRVKIRLPVVDTTLRDLEVGQPAQIRIERRNAPPEILEAKLTRISPFLDEVSRSTVAEIETDNPGHRLRPGMFVPVDISYGESQRATLVPASALFTEPNTGRVGVFVVTGEMPANVKTANASSAPTVASNNEPGATPAPPVTFADPRPVEFRSVNIIARGAAAVAVEPIRPGEWVVTLGQDLLATDGQPARVRAVGWEHVLRLQNMKREDLLQEVLRSSTTAANGGNGH